MGNPQKNTIRIAKLYIKMLNCPSREIKIITVRYQFSTIILENIFSKVSKF